MGRGIRGQDISMDGHPFNGRGHDLLKSADKSPKFRKERAASRPRFAGIAINHLPAFIVAQLIGATIGACRVGVVRAGDLVERYDTEIAKGLQICHIRSIGCWKPSADVGVEADQVVNGGVLGMGL
jgi:hypothetical protein